MSETTQYRDQIKLTFGREADWISINPTLLIGEGACILDDSTLRPKGFTFGNGILSFDALPIMLFEPPAGDSVYTEAQIDAFLSVIDGRLDALEISAGQLSSITLDLEAVEEDIVDLSAKIDPTATSSNYLASLSKVAELIDAAVDAIDTAPEFTTAQQNALDSGVTAEGLVQTASSISGLSTEKANKITGIYTNIPTLVEEGSGYSPYSRCTVNGVQGFITSVGANGRLLHDGIILLQTETSSSAATPVTVISQHGSGATATVNSSYSAHRDLSSVQQYLRALIDLVGNTNISKGKIDNLLRVIQGGETIPLYLPDSIRYVDASFSGIEQGLQFAPFTTGSAALDSFGPATAASPNVEAGVINFAAGTYSEALTITHSADKTILGQDLSHQDKTVIQSVAIGTGSSNIGIKNLSISQSLTVAGQGNNYISNVTVTGATSVNCPSFSFFENCSFFENVTVVSGDVEFNNCDFYGHALIVSSGATVVVNNCINLSVTVAESASYIHLAGSLLLTDDITYALSVSPSATFVGLYSGSATDATHAYAPINIPAGVPSALGLFVFDEDSSILPNDANRVSGDGISGRQIAVGARQGEEEGYVSDSTYLDKHLDAISAALKTIVSDSGSGTVTDVDIEPGTANGTIAIAVMTPEGTTAKDAIEVPGLGSAAFTDSSAYATAEQGNLASSAYQKDVAGIPKTDLAADIGTSLDKADSAEQTANKKTTISDESDTNYPTVGAVKRAVLDPLQTIQSHLPTLGTEGTDGGTLATIAKARELAEATIARLLMPAASGVFVFDDWDALTTATNFYYQGTTTDPAEGDIATYKDEIIDEGETISYEKRAQFDGENWAYRETLGLEFTSEQQAALNSGVTADFVTNTGTKLTDVEGVAGDKQDKIAAGTNSDILVAPVTLGDAPRTVTKLTSVREADSADASIVTEAAVRAAIDTAVSPKLTQPTSPTAGSAFLKLKADGNAEIDENTYLTETSAEGTYLKTADANFQPKIASGTNELLKAPASDGGAPDTMDVLTEVSEDPSDDNVLTEKAVINKIKEVAPAKDVDGDLAVPTLNTVAGGEVGQLPVSRDGGTAAAADDILLTDHAIKNKINSLMVTTKSISLPDPLQQSALDSIPLKSNTVYFSPDFAIAGTLDTVEYYPVLQGVTIAEDVYSNVSISAGEQSKTASAPNFPSLANIDSLYFVLTNDWNNKKFNNSNLNLYLPRAVQVEKLAFNKSIVTILHSSARAYSEGGTFPGTSSFIFKDTTAVIELDREIAAQNEIEIEAVNSIIHAHGETDLEFTNTGGAPSATVYLHGNAKISSVLAVNNLVVYICADAAAGDRVPATGNQPAFVVDLRNGDPLAALTTALATLNATFETIIGE